MFTSTRGICYNQKYKCIVFTYPNAVKYTQTFSVEIYY